MNYGTKSAIGVCLAFLLGLVALPAGPAAADNAGIAGAVRAGSVDNEYVIVVDNPNPEAALNGLSLKVVNRPRWITNIRIKPDGGPTLAPAASRSYTVRFDVAKDAGVQEIDSLHFEISASGALIDNPRPVMSVKIIPAKEPDDPQKPNAKGEKDSDPKNPVQPDKGAFPLLKLVKIDGPQSGLINSGFSSNKWYQVAYRPGQAGFSAKADYGDKRQPGFIAGVRFKNLPVEIVLGKPFELMAEVKQRGITKGYRQCYVSLPNKPERWDPIARFAALGISGPEHPYPIKGTRDLTVHCDSLPTSATRFAKGGPLVEKDDTVSIHIKMTPDRVEPPASPRGGCTVYHYNVAYDTNGKFDPRSSGPTGKTRFSFCKKTDERGYLLPYEKTPVDPTWGTVTIGCKFQSSILRLHYNAIHQGDPHLAAPPRYQWPPELMRPPRDQSGASAKPADDSGGGTGQGSGGQSGGQSGGGSGGQGPRTGGGSGKGSDRPEPIDKPLHPEHPDPGHAEVARLIGEWITNAKPPEAAVPGSDLHYNGKGKIVGRTSGGVIRASHDNASIDPEYLWANMRNLDSIDHCTLGEYVTAKLKKQSMASCKGRYGAVKNLKGMQLDKAEAEVRAAGFQYEVVTGSPAKKPQADGTVERQEPIHSQYMKKGQILKLTVHAPYAQSPAAKKAVKAAREALARCDFPLAQRRIIALHIGESKTSLLNDLAQRRAEYARIGQQIREAAELIRSAKYNPAIKKLGSAKGRAECSDQAREIEKLIKKAGLGQEKNRAKQARKALGSCELRTARQLINQLTPGRIKKRLQKKLAQFHQRIEIADSLHDQAMQKAGAKNYGDAEALLKQALDAAPCEANKNQIRKDLEKIKALEEKEKNLRTDIDKALMRCQYQEAGNLLERLGEGERKDKLKARLDKGLKKEREFLILIRRAENLSSGQNYQEALELLQQAKEVAVCIQHKNQADSRINAIQGEMPRTVPRLAGLSLEEASRLLNQEGLGYRQEPAGRPPSQNSAHKVKEAIPKAGSKVNPGAVITLKIYGKYRKLTPEEQVAATDCSKFQNAEAYWSKRRKRPWCRCKAGYEIDPATRQCISSRVIKQRDCDAVGQGQKAVWIEAKQKWQCRCPGDQHWWSDKKRCVICGREWPGTVPVWDAREQYNHCECPPGTEWGRAENRCRRKLTPQEFCNQLRPGSIAKGRTADGRINCVCPGGTVWDQFGDRCVKEMTPNQICAQEYPGSIAVGRNPDGTFQCDCPSGTQWNVNKTGCVRAQANPNNSDICARYMNEIRAIAMQNNALYGQMFQGSAGRNAACQLVINSERILNLMREAKNRGCNVQSVPPTSILNQARSLCNGARQ